MKQAKTTPTIASAMTDYLKSVKLTRSENTTLTYGKALKEFKKILVHAKIDPEKSSPTALTDGLIFKFISHLKSTAPATEQLYVRAIARFYKYLVGEELAEINLPRVELM